MSSNVNFTQAALNGLPFPAPGERAVYHDFGGSQSVSGLEVRVTSTGVKTFSVFKRVAGGKPERVTIGKFPEVSIDQAKKKAKAIIADLASGVSPSETKREARVQGMTLAEAVVRYIEEQTREDNALHLKARTNADYLGMIQPSRQTAKGRSSCAWASAMTCWLEAATRIAFALRLGMQAKQELEERREDLL